MEDKELYCNYNVDLESEILFTLCEQGKEGLIKLYRKISPGIFLKENFLHVCEEILNSDGLEEILAFLCDYGDIKSELTVEELISQFRDFVQQTKGLTDGIHEKIVLGIMGEQKPKTKGKKSRIKIHGLEEITKEQGKE